MDLIKNIIPDVIQSLSQKSPQDDMKIQRLWDQIVKDPQTRVLNYQDNILYILVEHNTRAYKLKMQSRTILKNLQDDIPELKQIVFKIGK